VELRKDRSYDRVKARRAVDARCGDQNREYTDIGRAPRDGHSGIADLRRAGNDRRSSP
jgi:hypothetical protein